MRLGGCALVAAVAVLGMATPAAAGSCANAGIRSVEAGLRQLERATVCLVNRKRRARDLRPLKRRRTLDRAAVRHSADMVRSELFSHSGSNGSDVADRARVAGYMREPGRWHLGENIGFGYDSYSPPLVIFRLMMDSHEHRANILDRRFREIGVGVKRGTPSGNHRETGATYTIVFGRHS